MPISLGKPVAAGLATGVQWMTERLSRSNKGGVAACQISSSDGWFPLARLGSLDP
jgi:hypothetical protein